MTTPRVPQTSKAAPDLLAEFRKEAKNDRRSSLIDAYVKTPSADTMSRKALAILKDDIDAIEEP